MQRAPALLRPRIVRRSAWGADERLVRARAGYTPDVRVVFVHHTDQPNGYRCSDVPRMLRALEDGHIGRGWDDIGYNFLVDRCGTVYEGRAGGEALSVKGAHTKGFNDRSVGIAAIGTYDTGRVPPRMLHAIAAVAAWKLGPGVDPRGTVVLRSDSSLSRYGKGHRARFHAVAGHRDAYATSCPGAALVAKLPWIRREAARIRAAGEGAADGSTADGAPRRPGGRG